MVRQKHAKTRSKCHLASRFGGRLGRWSVATSFVYHAWALTTYFEAFVLLVAALAPFTSFAGLGQNRPGSSSAAAAGGISAGIAEKESRPRLKTSSGNS